MKKFTLLEMQLLSISEKKAKKVSFDPIRTLILGMNETGKSSLIKSIYSAFGASAARQSGQWKEVNPIIFVRFKVDEDIYSILKDRKHYAIFDINNDIIEFFDSVTNALGPFLAKLFNFKLQLLNHQGELIIPPPAFLFLPFYVDQDSSWQESWKSFSNLSQIKKYKLPVIEYHTGLKANEYYETKGDLGLLESKIQELEKEKKISDSILIKIKEKLSDINFTINLEDFKEEIKELLLQCEDLKAERDKIKNRIVDIFNFKITLETQITITKQALNEARKDFNYASLEIEDNIDCPTCGTHFENSFFERFEIAMDENRCKELLINLNRELFEINDKIEKENKNLNIKSLELLKIEGTLEVKKGEIKLRDVIESEGRKELKIVFQKSIDELKDAIIDNARKQMELNERLKVLDNKKRKDNIRSDYKILMKKYLLELGLNLKESDYKDITKNISNTGSALPRSLTAYYFTIFNLIKKYGSSTFCPIIIDSPNQQGQDSENIDKLLLFIKNNQPANSQMILGLENTFNIDFECKSIVLDQKHQLLQSSDYDEVNSNLTPFFYKMWTHGKTGKLFKTE